MSHLLSFLIVTLVVKSAPLMPDTTQTTTPLMPDTTQTPILLAPDTTQGTVPLVPDTTLSKEPGRFYSERGFSIWFPPGWRIEEVPEGLSAVDSLSMAPGAIPVTLMIDKDLAIPTAPKTQQDSLRVRMSQQATPSRVVLEKLGVVSVARGKCVIDRTAAEWVIRDLSVGSVNQRFIQYTLVKNPWAYVVTGLATKKQFPKYRKIFEQIGLSLRVEQTQ